MLVLSRKIGEKVIIGNGVEVVVLKASGNTVRLGFVAPHEVSIQREEVYQRIRQEEQTLLGLSSPVDCQLDAV